MFLKSLTVCWQHLTIIFSNLVNRSEFECAGSTNDFCWFRVDLLDRQLLCIHTSIFAWSFCIQIQLSIFSFSQYKNKPVFWLPSFSVWWIGDGEGYVPWVGRDYVLGGGGITTWVGEGFFFWGLGVVFFTFYTLTFFTSFWILFILDLEFFTHIFTCCLYVALKNIYIDLEFVYCLIWAIKLDLEIFCLVF